jgi:hypothetical protein
MAASCTVCPAGYGCAPVVWTKAIITLPTTTDSQYAAKTILRSRGCDEANSSVHDHAVRPTGHARDHQVTGKGGAIQQAFEFSSRVAFLVYEELKPESVGTYERAESGVVHGYEQDKIPVY